MSWGATDGNGIQGLTLTLAKRCALASRRASVYSDPIINSCDLYANSGHFFRRGNGGSFVGPADAQNPIGSRIRTRSINKSATIRRKTNVFATHQQIDLGLGLAPVAQPLAASCP